MRLPIRKEGLQIAGVLAVIGIIVSQLEKWFGRLFYLLSAFTLYFFRDPEREIPQGENLIVSPADGEIVGVDSVEHCPFIDGPAQRITIFLSIFNVHINRSPVKGKVEYRHYTPGKFIDARDDKSSLENERNAIGIETADGKRYLVVQIAGLIARRIVCWKNPGEQLETGERFGLIKFGSRTEIYMPIDAKIQVKRGQKVMAGTTVIGYKA